MVAVQATEQKLKGGNADLFAISLGDEIGEFRAGRDRSLLASMIASGKHWLSIGCRGGGCGVCRIKVIAGQFETLPMNRARVSVEDEASGFALACRVFPQSDMRIIAVPLDQIQGDIR